MNYKFKKSKKGFTLLELLISAAIFAIVVTVGIDLFFTIVKVQRRTTYVQDLQSDARYVLEIMAREVRLGNIDYDYYLDIDPDPANTVPLELKELRDSDNENKILATRDQDNNRYFFERVHEPGDQQVDGSDKYVIKICSVDATAEASTKCHNRYNGDYSEWDTITPEGIHVEKFLIFIKPETDPFRLDESIPGYLSHEQPMATIVLHTKTDRDGEVYKVINKLQTTVSSRAYVR